MHARVLAIGHADAGSFDLAMTQSDFGEVCGLSNVHVSRVVRQLREDGLCDVPSSKVRIHELRGLVLAGVLPPDYLYLNPQTASRAAGHLGDAHG